MENKAWKLLRRWTKAEERRIKRRFGMGRIVEQLIYKYDEFLKKDNK